MKFNGTHNSQGFLLIKLHLLKLAGRNSQRMAFFIYKRNCFVLENLPPTIFFYQTLKYFANAHRVHSPFENQHRCGIIIVKCGLT